MVKVTQRGILELKKKITKTEERLKEIRMEKTIAYENSGDTWHDNPYFKMLEQDEIAANKQLFEFEQVLKSAEIISLDSQNSSSIQIGSIGLWYCQYEKFDEEITLEIVGYGESDFESGKIAYNTPVGSQLIGIKVGESREITIPSGMVTYTLKEIICEEE